MMNTPAKGQATAGYPATPQGQNKAHIGMQHFQLPQQQQIPGQVAGQPVGVLPGSMVGVMPGGGGVAVGGGMVLQQQQQQEETEVITRKKLQELVGQISSGEVLDPEVEEVLLEVVDDFIDSVTTFACSLAKHRSSTTLEVRDLITHLERNWNIKIPGYGAAEASSMTASTNRPFKRALAGSDAHKTRLALVRKSLAPPAKQQKLL